MNRHKIAVATSGSKGLEDKVSDVFGRAKTFTIVELEDDQIKDVEVKENPGASYEYGAGPIAAKMLVEAGVKVVISGEFGPGASTLLEQGNIRAVKVEAGMKVMQAINTSGVKAP